jgi:uncharacterized protein YqgV (UPF0045/DUF77 family)
MRIERLLPDTTDQSALALSSTNAVVTVDEAELAEVLALVRRARLAASSEAEADRSVVVDAEEPKL